MDAKALREMWASDDEVSIDLVFLGSSLLAGLSRDSGTVDLVREVIGLGKMKSEQLSQERSMSTERAKGLFAALAHPDCSAILQSSRRRWPQALALSGAWGTQWEDADALFAKASEVGAAWLACNDPRMCASKVDAARCGAVQIALGKEGVSREFIAAWAAFGEQLGAERAMESALEALKSARAARLSQPSLPSMRLKEIPWEACQAIFEREWLAAAVPKGNGKGPASRL